MRIGAVLGRSSCSRSSPPASEPLVNGCLLRYGASVVKKALLIALVVVLVLVGLPIPVAGMGSMTCIDCAVATAVHMVCVAALFALAAVVVAVATQTLNLDRRKMLAMLLGTRLERPPQLA